MYGSPQNLKYLQYSPLQKSLLTPENVTKEMRKRLGENTGEPREKEIFPNDSKSRSKKRKDG